ncbi:MAG: hypothetical protein MZU79_02305 [Anaerotruncus sp.]|nr:hypothetical protein [Anaerotruncus sp.]
MIGVAAEVPRAGRAGRDDAQVRPGDHQGHGRQEDPRHRRHPGRHQQEPVDRRARRASCKDIDQMIDVGRGALKIAQGLHRRSTWQSWPAFGSFDSNHLSLVRGRRRHGPVRRQPARHRRRRAR